jgi:hypothetical protein
MTNRKKALANLDDAALAVRAAMPASAQRADSVLVDAAVTRINEILHRTVSLGMDEVGRYLLDTFYEGKPELLSSMHPGKHASISTLLARCEGLDLPVSRTFLANSLRMAAISKNLPRGSRFHELPPTHRLTLLPLRQPDLIERLAERALDKNLSVGRLRELVHKDSEKRAADGARRGRRPEPMLLKQLGACVRALHANGGRLQLKKSEVEALSEEQRRAARDAHGHVQKRIEEIGRILGA